MLNLDHLKDLEAKATKGPWFEAFFDDDQFMGAVGISKTNELLKNRTNLQKEWEVFGQENERRLIAITGVQAGIPVGDWPNDSDCESGINPSCYSTTSFIVALRNAFPEIIAELERLNELESKYLESGG